MPTKETEKDEANVKKIVYVKSSIDGKKAIVPIKGSEYAHCHDLFIAEDFSILPGSIKKVSAGLIMEIPTGYAALIRERSSTITKFNMTVEAGDIDSDYRGNVSIVFHRKEGISLWKAIKQSYMDYIHKSYDEASTMRDNSSKLFNAMHSFWLRARLAFHPMDVLADAWSTWRKRNKTLSFKRGDSLAQIEIVKVLPFGFAKLPAGRSMSMTKRGSGGFGSTTKSTAKKIRNKKD